MNRRLRNRDFPVAGSVASSEFSGMTPLTRAGVTDGATLPKAMAGTALASLLKTFPMGLPGVWRLSRSYASKRDWEGKRARIFRLFITARAKLATRGPLKIFFP